MVKACSKCKAEFALDAFPPNGKRRSPYCPDCKRSYDRAYYERTRERRKERKRRTDKKLRQRNKELVLAYLSCHPCVDCGEPDPVVLDFDHREREKKRADVSALMHAPSSVASLREEIDKCDVRCANCHRRRTSVQFGWFYSGV